MDAWTREFGDVFTIRFPVRGAMVFLSEPEAVRQVFAGAPDQMHAGPANDPLKPFLGPSSLILLDGAAHQRHRRLVMPPFHGERMLRYGPTMLELADAEIDRWPLGKPFAVHRSMQAITLQVILRTVFGLSRGPEHERMSTLLTEALDIASDPRLLLPWFQIDLGRLTRFGRFRRVLAESDALLHEQIRLRRAHPGTDDVLSLLASAKDESGAPALTDAELRDELVTLLVAGHETTATALAWALRWLLVRHDLRARLVDEIRGAEVDGRLDPERVGKLELLDATVRETLRLQPVVPLVGRELQSPQTIAGHELPAKVLAVPCIWGVHHRPSLYPDPHKFEPERFLRRKYTPYEWLPFGGGARKCVGMHFALQEMKMVLAAVLRRAELELLPGRPVRAVRRSITLTPSEGLPVVLQRRFLPGRFAA
jgi:cytochrome P450